MNGKSYKLFHYEFENEPNYVAGEIYVSRALDDTWVEPGGTNCEIVVERNKLLSREHGHRLIHSTIFMIIYLFDGLISSMGN